MGAAELEAALRHESDERRTERWFWIAGLIVLLDIIAVGVNGWVLAALLPLEVIILIALAHWFEIEFVRLPLQQLLEHYLGGKSK